MKRIMKAGDLIRHKKIDRTALILDATSINGDGFVKVLFSGDSRSSNWQSLKLVMENWKIINE